MKSEECSQANELGYVVKSEECSQREPTAGYVVKSVAKRMRLGMWWKVNRGQ